MVELVLAVVLLVSADCGIGAGADVGVDLERAHGHAKFERARMWNSELEDTLRGCVCFGSSRTSGAVSCNISSCRLCCHG